MLRRQRSLGYGAQGLGVNHSLEAAGLGVHMHYLFELYLNRGIVKTHSMEFRLLMKFLSEFPEPEILAGAIDFVAVNERGWLVLVDWKRTKDLEHKYSTPFQKMLPPIEVLRNP